jgi:hypothetical protein
MIVFTFAAAQLIQNRLAYIPTIMFYARYQGKNGDSNNKNGHFFKNCSVLIVDGCMAWEKSWIFYYY